MTARTFGRRGMSEAGAGAGAVSARRAALLGVAPSIPEPVDDAATRRAAFLAEERERAGPAANAPAPSEEAIRAVIDEGRAERLPTDRSLNVAIILWSCLGLVGGHRFYLRRPLSGGLQAALFLGCWGATLMEYFAGLAGLAAGFAWTMADGVRLRALHAQSGPR